MKKRITALMLTCLLTLYLGTASSALAAGNTFTDVPVSHWAYRDIEDMAAQKVINGLGDGRFDPDGNVTVASFSAMVARLFFADELSKNLDQPKEYWWQPYADTLMELGAYALTDIRFSYGKNGEKWVKEVIEAPLNRYVMAGIMDNVMGLKNAIFPNALEETAVRKEIADLTSIPPVYVNSVSTMYAMGLLHGMDSEGNFRGEEQVSRAQACAVLARMVDKLESQTPDDVPDISFEGWDTERTLEVGTASIGWTMGLPRGTKLTAVSSNPAVVSCNDGGGIKAVAPGVAQVTYTARFWHKSAQMTVTVTVVGKAGPDSDIHALRENMLAILNRERAEEGRKSLALDEGLCQAAQVRARELVQSFSHTRPGGRSCDTALDEMGINYRIAGENIAAGQMSIVEVMDGWMDSPGHRANILDERYSRIGIGCAFSDDGYGTYWVQVFTN